MPLQDQSANIQMYHSPFMNHKKRPIHGSANPPAASNLPPLAVQSMLRTTTELGDGASLHHSLVHRPHSGTRLQSTRPRSGSYDSSFASALRHRRSLRARLDRGHTALHRPAFPPRLARHDTVYSNLSSYTDAPRRRSRRNRWQAGTLQGLDDPRFPSHMLDGHRSLTTLRSYRGNRSRHMDMPSALSLRQSGRPSYEDPSYQWLGANRMPQPRSVFADSRHSTDSSPVSFLSRHGPIGYKLNTHSSTALPSRLPSPAIYMPVSLREKLLQPRKEIPKTMLEQRARRISDIHRGSDKELVLSVSDRGIPRYYDYTESFTDEDCFSPDSRRGTSLMRSNIDDAITQSCSMQNHRIQSPSDIRLGSMFRPAELPTKHNRRASEQSDVLGKYPLAELDAVEAHAQDVVCPPESSTQASLSKKRISHRNTLMQSQNVELEASEAATIGLANTRLSSCSHQACALPESNLSVLCSNESRGHRSPAALAACLNPPLKHIAIQEEPTLLQAGGEVTVARIMATTAHVSSGPISAANRPDSLLPRPSNDNDNEAFSNELYLRRTSECVEVPEIAARQLRQSLSSQSHGEPKTSPGFSKDVLGRSLPQFQPDIEGLTLLEHRHERPVNLIEGLSASGIRKSERTPKLVSDKAEVSGERSTPQRAGHTSIVTSNGKSTIDSLLDRHIESLGLMPEHGSPCRSWNQSSSCCQDRERDEDGTMKFSHNFFWQGLVAPSRAIASSIRRASSLDSRVQNDLKPPRLFAGIVSGRLNRSAPTLFTSDLQQEPSRYAGGPSDGWLTLPSTSRGVSRNQLSKFSLTSGELADVDTNICSPTFQNWSQLSLPTTMEEVVGCRQSLGAISERRRYGFRRVKIHIRQPIRQSKSDDFSHRMPTTAALTSYLPPRPPPLLLRSSSYSSPESLRSEPQEEMEVHNAVELDEQDSSPPDWQVGENHQNGIASVVPSRWSSIIAAMPVPLPMHDERTQELPRKASARTQQSQPCQRSHASVVEPLNSSHQRTQIPQLSSDMPRLARPDLGPPLDTSTLNLSIPYAEVPSTIHPSPQETKSFFDDSLVCASRRSIRARFGIPCLRGASRDVRASSSLADLDPYGQNSRMRDAGPLCGLRAQASLERSDLLDENLPLSDCAYRRRKIAQRIRSWWRPRYCWHKIVPTKKTKASYTNPGGLLV